ncbi:triphosphoribosyl-dephospho-CoA synthase [Saccharopolyspora sp. 5N708]|uniref:triphosphoribosyl-dephospho-CoA synthase n=1 Tax=Saccharopolyspora sp. 5N708 TaxID=3457424 RepID=UPI003FCFE99F
MSTATRVRARLAPRRIAEFAVAALRAEAELTPKPGLTDRRGGGAHRDMTLDLLIHSAEALRVAFQRCAEVATTLPLGLELRAELGAIGRDGERRMLAVTGGVNTHRGALWALGLLSAGIAQGPGSREAVGAAAELARLPDHRLPPESLRPLSHGARARQCYGAVGAAGEARAEFPHVTDHALPALRRARARGADEASARLDALLAVMASLEDTCLLHRGGPRGLAAIRGAAAGVLAAGGCGTVAGRLRLAALDRLARTRRLSPGGSADLLSAAVFLDSLPVEKGHPDRHADPDLPISR